MPDNSRSWSHLFRLRGKQLFHRMYPNCEHGMSAFSQLEDHSQLVSAGISISRFFTHPHPQTKYPFSQRGLLSLVCYVWCDVVRPQHECVLAALPLITFVLGLMWCCCVSTAWMRSRSLAFFLFCSALNVRAQHECVLAAWRLVIFKN